MRSLQRVGWRRRAERASSKLISVHVYMVEQLLTVYGVAKKRDDFSTKAKLDQHYLYRDLRYAPH